jgi:hypothetical protein
VPLVINPVILLYLFNFLQNINNTILDKMKRIRTVADHHKNPKRKLQQSMRKRQENRDGTPATASADQFSDGNEVIKEEIYEDLVEGDEAVYCTCRQVSYGDMVACDNEVR